MKSLQFRRRKQIAEPRKYCLVHVIFFFGMCFLYFCFLQVGNFGLILYNWYQSLGLSLSGAMVEEAGKASGIAKFDSTDFAYWRM